MFVCFFRFFFSLQGIIGRDGPPGFTGPTGPEGFPVCKLIPAKQLFDSDK